MCFTVNLYGIMQFRLDLLFAGLLECFGTRIYVFAVSVHSKSVDMGSAQHKSIASTKKKAPKGMYESKFETHLCVLQLLAHCPHL